MLSIEKAFNQIWAVKRSRAFLKRVMTFYALLSLGPACLVLLVTIGRWLDLENQLVQLGLGNLTTFLRSFWLVCDLQVNAAQARETPGFRAVVVSIAFWCLCCEQSLFLNLCIVVI